MHDLAIRGEVGKTPLPLAKILEIRLGHRVAPSLATVECGQHGNLLGVPDAKGFPEQSVQSRIHGGRDTQAESERQHRKDDKEGSGQQAATSERDVAEQSEERTNERQPPYVATLFFVRLDRAELHPSPTRCLVARKTSSRKIVGAMLDMNVQFVSHVALEPGSRQDHVQRSPDALQQGGHGYTSPGRLSSAAAMIVTIRFQPVVSSRSRFRPAGVRR